MLHEPATCTHTYTYIHTLHDALEDLLRLHTRHDRHALVRTSREGYRTLTPVRLKGVKLVFLATSGFFFSCSSFLGETMRKEGPLCKEDSRQMLSVTHVSFCRGGILSADSQFVNYMNPVSQTLLGRTVLAM